MTKDIDIFGGKQGLPAYINNFFDDEDSNIEPRVSVPSLSYGGKTWAITIGGEKTKITKVDAEGDEQPVAIMRVVVLDQAKERGRTYYEGSYDPDNQGSPVCWSDDGVKPDASITEPQSRTCAQCPMAAKGSRVSENGKATTACSQHRMLAVIPVNALKSPEFPPLRMKIAITSDFDKQSPELEKLGWRAWRQTIDYLYSRGAKHTAALEMKMRFDPNVDYPKVMFQPVALLAEDQLKQVKRIRDEHDIKALLRGSNLPVATDTPAVTEDDDDDGEEVAPAKPAAKPAAKTAAKPAAKAKAAPVEEDADDDDDGIPYGSKAALDDDDEGVEDATPAKAAKPAAKAKAKAEPAEDADASTGEIPDDMAELLGEWDD